MNEGSIFADYQALPNVHAVAN